MSNPDPHEGEAKAHDGAENGNGGSIADQADTPPVPEIMPKPLGPGGTVPMPKMPGRKQPPTNIMVKITEAKCEGAGQLDEESEVLLVVRGKYKKATTEPKFDGEGRVTSRDYTQMVRPTWAEDFDAFLDANGLKLVRKDEEGDAVNPGDLVNIEELRREKEDALS
jgi:hypothetical protein